MGIHGVGLLYKENLQYIITPIYIGHDRICVMERNTSYVIVVYLPQQRCIIGDFKECLDILN